MAKDVRYKLELDAKGFSAGVKEAESQFNGLVKNIAADSGKLGEVLSAVGPLGVLIAATAGAVVMFGKATFDAAQKAVDFAGKISDLSTKSGVGGEALQKLAYAGSLVGTQLDDVTTAIGKLQQHMVSAPEDFAQLGLSMQHLKTLAPEKQFEEVGRAILAIQDPAQRTAATIAFMGKGGQEALKLLSLDLRATGDEAERLGNVMHDDTREALDALGDSVTTLSTTWDHLVMNWGGSIAQIPEIQQLVKDLTEKLGEMSRWVLANKDQIGEYAREAISWGKDFASAIGAIGSALIKFKNSDAYKVLSLLNAPVRMATTGAGLGAAWKSFSDWAGWSGGSGGQSMADQWNGALAPGLNWGAAAGGTKAGGKAPGWVDPAELKRQAAEQEKIQKLLYDSRIRALREIDKEVENEYKRNVVVVGQILETGADQEKQIAQHRAEIYKVLSDQMALGQRNAQIWREIEARGLDLNAAKWGTYGAALHTVGESISGPVGSAISGLGGIFDGLAIKSERAADNLRKNGTTAMTTGQKIQAAAQAVGVLSAAFERGVQSANKWGSALNGAISGAATGASIAGGWGAFVGAIAGGVAGYLGGQKGEKQQLAAMREEFARLWEEAAKAGVVFQHTFDPKTPQQFKDAIDEIHKAMDIQNEAQQRLNEAVERYGFTIGELGPAFAQQQLDKQMGQLLQDWKLLTAAGVDHEAMLNRVGPEVGKLVDQYVAGGIEIPKAMKPVIDDLYQHGKLLHANGDAYTEAEYNALTYGATTSQMFQDLIVKIGEFVDAINAIYFPDKTLNVNEHYHPDPNRPNPNGGGGPLNYDGTPDNDQDPTTGNGMAAGGIVRARPGGSWKLLGEGGEDEAVIPLSKLPGMGAGGAPQTLVLHLSLTPDMAVLDTVMLQLDRRRGTYVRAR